MCYQECRWHAICNHTIRSKVECPKQCSEEATDIVETQLTAYCHACRRHVDSLGVTAQYRNAANRLSRRRSRRASNLPLASSVSVENLRATASSPTPSNGSVSRSSSLRTVSRSSMSKRLTSTASTGDLRGEVAVGRKASMGTIMSVFMQEQQEHEQEKAGEDGKVLTNENNAVPEVKSPIPQKPQLSLRIPEEAVTQFASPTPATASSTTSDGFHSAHAALSPEPESKSPKLRGPSSTAPTTPKTPSRSPLSFSLEDPASKAPPPPPPPSTDPPHASLALPSPKHTFSSTIRDIRRGLRKTKSSSRLLGGGQPPYLLQHKNIPIEPIPSPPLRRSKSNWTLSSDASSPTSLRADSDWSGTAPAPPTMLARPRPVPPAGSPLKPVTNKDFINIHDPAWLGKHGLKWDVHGLGIVSASM